MRSVIQNNSFTNIELAGWCTWRAFLRLVSDFILRDSFMPPRYWYLEDIPDYDLELISFISASAHAAGELVTWIPSYDGSSGDAVWKNVSELCSSIKKQASRVCYQVGFDFVTQQPNYAFRDTTLQRFVNVSIIMDTFTTGAKQKRTRMLCLALCFRKFWHEPAGVNVSVAPPHTQTQTHTNTYAHMHTRILQASRWN